MGVKLDAWAEAPALKFLLVPALNEEWVEAGVVRRPRYRRQFYHFVFQPTKPLEGCGLGLPILV